MTNRISLNQKKELTLKPKAPYNFKANFYKPSHFPSSDNVWEKRKYWITTKWEGKELGLKFKNKGTINNPKIKLIVYHKGKLTKKFLKSFIPEVRYRFNFNQDISNFNFDSHPAFKKWEGMKPIAANSLYETLVIYFVLQNASVRRSVQMLENLFNKFGKKAKFDNKTLSVFWEPKEIAKSSEKELRNLKLGYRSKFLIKLSKQFADKKINESTLRKMDKEEVKKEMLKLYGIGPASVEYLLFEDFYFLDALETIPPWEQKILSILLFNKKLVPTKKILNFFKKYKKYKKLAFHYIWEDIFWQRKYKYIGWLEKEIRL